MALNTFISRLKEGGYQRQNKFSVTIHGPDGAYPYEMSLFAETVEIPGQTVISSPDELRYGPLRELDTALTYGPTSMTFICTPGLPERKWFTDWQDKVINKENWEAFYYKEYAACSSVNVYALDADEKPKYGVTLFEVFPKTVSGQSFSHGSNDAYQTLDVEFAFRYWKEIAFAGPSTGPAGR